MFRTHALLIAATALAVPGVCSTAFADEVAGEAAPATRPAEAATPSTERAIAFLLETQHETGGWAQGDLGPQMQNMPHEPHVLEEPNVADTCIAGLALMRHGTGPGDDGDRASALRRAGTWAVEQVEAADPATPHVTDHFGTCTQRKLGNLVDTFFAGWFLSEYHEALTDGPERDRVGKALATVTRKMEVHQGTDGRWQQEGWATAISQGIAVKALNLAEAQGVPVDAEVRTRAVSRVDASLDADDAAGIGLYARASKLQQASDARTYYEQNEGRFRTEAEDASLPAERRAQAQQQLALADANAEVFAGNAGAAVDEVQREEFVAGFGSDGGEELLSFFNLLEALSTTEPGEAAAFRSSLDERLATSQLPDGSWAGQHCITGKTFCTAAALLVLSVE